VILHLLGTVARDVQRADVRKLQITFVINQKPLRRIRRTIRGVWLTRRGSQFRVIPDRDLQDISRPDLVRARIGDERCQIVGVALHHRLLRLLHRRQRDIGNRDLLGARRLAIVSIADG